MRHFRSLFIYGFTIFFNAAISFLTLSLVTHHLSKEAFGIINLFNSLVIFLSPFIGVGVQYILGVDFFKMDELKFRSHFTNAMSIPVMSFLLFTIVFFVFHSYVENFIHINLLFTLLVPFACLLTICVDVMQALIRDRAQHRLFSIYSIGKNLVEISLTILFVIGLNLSWKGRLTSNVLTLVVMLFIILLLIKKWKLFTGSFDKTDIRKSFFAGLPFVPERLAIFILGYSDRFFINYYQGTGDVGFYSAGAQIAVIVNLCILTLSNVFYPAIFKSLSGRDSEVGKLKKVVLAYVGISAAVTVCVLITIPFFFKYFIGPDFQEGQRYAFLLTIAFFFWAIYNVFLAFLLNAKKNKLIMGISICGTLLSIVSNFLLVRRYGALGATYTSIFVYFFMALAVVFFVHRHYNLSAIFKNSKVVHSA